MEIKLRVPLQIVGDDSDGQSVIVSSQKTVNYYAQIEDKGAKTRLSFYPTPGLKHFSSAGDGPCRGDGCVFDRSGEITKQAFFVSGSKLIGIDFNGTSTEIGTLDTSSGPVSMAVGASDLMVVDGTRGYTWDGTDFKKLVNPPTQPDYVTWIDNYFVVNKHNTGRFFISGIDDPSTWNALDFATAESRPDLLLRPVWFRKNLLLVGQETSELYYNSGNLNFPFDRFPNVLFEYGTPAADSVARLGQHVFMISQTQHGGYNVIQLSSETPNIVSNNAIEWELNNMTNIVDAKGFAYEQAGHQFYVVTFTGDNKTFVYDINSGLWHERQSSDGNRFRVSGHVFFEGKHVVGDRVTNMFYTMELDVFDEVGYTVERLRRTTITHDKRLTLFFDKLELDIESGVGLTNGIDPQMMLRWSDDGGKTWSSAENRSMGLTGQYLQRLRWTRLGRSRNRVYEFKTNEAVKSILVDAHMDMRIGRD